MKQNNCKNKLENTLFSFEAVNISDIEINKLVDEISKFYKNDILKQYSFDLNLFSESSISQLLLLKPILVFRNQEKLELIGGLRTFAIMRALNYNEQDIKVLVTSNITEVEIKKTALFDDIFSLLINSSERNFREYIVKQLFMYRDNTDWSNVLNELVPVITEKDNSIACLINRTNAYVSKIKKKIKGRLSREPKK